METTAAIGLPFLVTIIGSSVERHGDVSPQAITQMKKGNGIEVFQTFLVVVHYLLLLFGASSSGFFRTLLKCTLFKENLLQ